MYLPYCDVSGSGLMVLREIVEVAGASACPEGTVLEVAKGLVPVVAWKNHHVVRQLREPGGHAGRGRFHMCMLSSLLDTHGQDGAMAAANSPARGAQQIYGDARDRHDERPVSQNSPGRRRD